MVEEENKKMYTALLQNQVLGIDNPFLLHEIHDSDENYMQGNLYSQMQRQNLEEQSLLSSPSKIKKKNTLGESEDSSPYKTKYTVLKFNNPQLSSPPKGTYAGGFSTDSPSGRGIFTNSSNY